MKRIVALILTLVMVFALCACGGSSGGGSSNSRTCSACGRTYTDHDNIHSIQKTNMCVNCYNNYQWAKKATGRGTAYHDDCDNDEYELIALLFHEENTAANIEIAYKKGNWNIL